MRVASEVSKRKFDRELTRLREQVDVLNERGIFLAGTQNYPLIDLVYVPRSPLGIQVQRQQAPLIIPIGASMEVQFAEIPALAGRAFKVRFDLTDYDLRAPSIVFLDPWTNTPIPFRDLVRGQEFEPARGLHLVMLDPHPTTGLPFLCLRGVREYHEHPQHSGDDWMLYRQDVNVFTLALAIWRVDIDLVRPLIAPAPQGGVQVVWVGMEKA